MKMAFQTILWIVMICSGLLWMLSQGKIRLYDLWIQDVDSDKMLEFVKSDIWQRVIEEPIIQQTTHADEVFWICLVAWILTLKVRT